MNRVLIAMLAGGLALVLRAPPVRAAPAILPVELPGSVKMLGTVDVAAAARSISNAEALAALAAAKPAAPRPRLLPDGRETRFASPALNRLPHLSSNISVSGGISSIGGFTGIYEGTNTAANGYELEPPDQGLAVDHGIIGEIVNNTIQFFKSGAPLTNPLATTAFFATDKANALSDPHILFDPSVQRWFVDELTSGGPLGYGFLLAVSKTSDPAGSYIVYFIASATTDLPACTSTGCLPDFPQVGYDANAFYITADLFGPRRYAGAAVYALAKSQLITGGTPTALRFVLPEFVMQPAVPAPGEAFVFANGGTEYLMTARNIDDGSDRIRLYAIENTNDIVAAPRKIFATYKTFETEPYMAAVPSTQPDVIGPWGRQQKAQSAPSLDGGYDAFTANVVMARGHLYAALTTGTVDGNGLPRDSLAYFVINTNTSSPHLSAQGYAVPPDGYSISYPALALDRRGDGYIGVTITNPDKRLAGGYPSTAILPFGRSGPGSITVTGAGAAADDGFTGYGAPHEPGSVGRWGDYAAACIDPATGIFYTANEFIPDPAIYPRGVQANWGTFVTAIQGTGGVPAD